MTKSKKYIVTTLVVAALAVVSTGVQAAPRGTPTIVTNDASAPVVVSGIVSNSNPKPVGITTGVISGGATMYAKSLLCVAQYPSSHICSTLELINAPGLVTAPIQGAWVRSIPADANAIMDVSGVGYTYYRYNVHLMLQNNEIVYNPIDTISLPVVCCAP